MNSHSKDTRHKMEIVLRERKTGKPRELCAKAAKIPPSRITHWCNEGKQRIGKDNIYFYETLTKIEEELENRKKYEKEAKEYSFPENINKRVQYINNIRDGQTRQQASKNAKLDLKLVTKWDSLGRKGIKPFRKFHKDYTDARSYAERRAKSNKEKIKNETIKQIKNGKTLEKAAKSIENGKYEKTIINWYNAGKHGDKNHIKFYQDCENAKQKPVNSDIMGPLPRKWQQFFKDKPMNQTGIAWVNKSGNNWVYTRQINSQTIRFSDPDIRKLHKKVIGKNYVWGIRDPKKARKIIFGTTNTTKSNVTVNYIRTSKNKFKVRIKGSIKNNELLTVLNKLKFFEVDMTKKEIKQVNDKTDIKIELDLNISLLNSFEEKIKSLGWKINK